jgi:hypothetical protein
MTTVHNATSTLEDELVYWVSLDGKLWLPVSRPCTDEDAEHVQKMFDGDGNFMPLRFGRDFLIHQGATFAGEEE